MLMPDDINIIDFQALKGEGIQDAQKEALREMKEGKAHFVEALEIDSYYRRKKYEALIKEGFSVYQVLELCRGRLI